MKNTNFKVAIVGFMLIGLISCNDSLEKEDMGLKEAQAEMLVSKVDLEEAKLDSTKDYKEHIIYAMAKLVENDKLIIELMTKRINTKEPNQKKYEEELIKLQEKGYSLELIIAEPRDKWANFSFSKR